MEKKENTLFVERFRPTTLEHFVGNQTIKETLQKYLDQGDIQNFIFYATPGTGKTTLAKIIVKNLDCDYLYINASDERGIDTVRDKITGFASTMSFKPLKVVILDEADFLMGAAQAALRNVIETFSKNTRFIFTCNYIERIIEPLQSRCEVYKLSPPSKQDVARHVVNILKQENVTFEATDVAALVNLYYPDIRKIINTSQGCVRKSELVFNKEVLVSSNYLDKILSILKKPTSQSFNQIRQIIADSNTNEFDNAFRYIFDNIDDFKELSPQIAILS
jgi:DNA polymerase III delta prime subunit